MSARVLVTGGSGFIGSQVVHRLADDEDVDQVVSVDVRPGEPQPGVRSVEMDIRDPGLVDVVTEAGIDRIVHLAAIVTPQPHHTREFLRSVDVGGTENVIAAAVAAGVDHLTVMSSGAAYGYHADNPEWLTEDDPVRGNPEFAYSDHKRVVEERLAGLRSEQPDLRQLILRPGTVLGPTVDNQITRLWEWPVILAVSGSETPFVFIWDSDLVEVVVRGTKERRSGIYNLAGDGAVPLSQIAAELGKRRISVPAPLIRGALTLLSRAGVSQYGPEQVDFLTYRPVLSNRRLVEEFGYRPEKTSLEAFRSWMASRG
jgi:UDP-glucose 4-epimerase